MTWEADFDTLIASFDTAPLGQVQTFCSRVRSKVDAFETRRIAAEAGSDTDRGARIAARGGKRSKRAARQQAGRAAAVKKNPKLGDALDSGRLSTEQLDTIASAAETNEAAATDQELIDTIAAASVDQGRRFARDWLQKQADKDRTETLYERQRRERRAAPYPDPQTGLSALKLSGDDATLAELWNQIQLREKQLWNADGGRDIPEHQHRRTKDQRLFDAAVELILGTSAGTSTPSTASRSRPSIVININGDNPDEPAELVGTGPIADTAVAALIERADLFVRIHDLTSETMWLGRLNRRATAAQYRALVARDKGCVRCGAHWLKCEAHHLTPWNSPAKGETNIDELALVCSGCHHELHSQELTLERISDGTWKTRPALDIEIAPKRPRNQPEASRAPDWRHNTEPPPGATQGRCRPPETADRATDRDNPGLFPRPSRPSTASDDPDGAA